MSLPVALSLILAFSLTMYAVFAGADFGAGILDLLSGAGTSERASIARTISPLWEANHVWLIFSITILFSAFPVAFAALGTALLAPLTLALLAIVLRGVAFALRAQTGSRAASEARLGALFGAASLGAPLLFGAIAGGLAQASSPRRASPVAVPIPWTGLFAVIVGLLAVALCTQLAAKFHDDPTGAFGADRAGRAL
jgi:cytochrome bd ubiquinol oxidase subunit II